MYVAVEQSDAAAAAETKAMAAVRYHHRLETLQTNMMIHSLGETGMSGSYSNYTAGASLNLASRMNFCS